MNLPGTARADSTPEAGGSGVARLLPLCLLLLLAAAGPAHALDPGKLLTQYGHTAWRAQDGYVYAPNAITQTTDGYIWIGTRHGLIRFDGVKFTTWTPPEGQSLPGGNIPSLLGARDGSLWVGTTRGVARIKDGQYFDYGAQSGRAGVGAIIEDEAGTIWFTRYRITDGKGPLCRVTGEEFRCYGKEDGIPVTYGLGLRQDAAGNIWFGSSALVRWAPGAVGVYFEEDLKQLDKSVVDVAPGPSGEVWAGVDHVGPRYGVRRLSGGKWESFTVPGFNGAEAISHTLFVDSHNALWIGTEDKGLYRIHNGVAHQYGTEDGLSANNIGSIFEDREGNIWVATDSGVDMFRDTPVVTFSINEGLSGSGIESLLALGNGDIWVSNGKSVDVLRAGGGQAFTTPSAPRAQQELGAMFEDRAGRVWLGVDQTLMTYEGGRLSEVRKPDGTPLGRTGFTWGITEDVGGDIWALMTKGERRHLFRVRGRTVLEEIPLDKSLRRPSYLAADRQGGVWVGASTEKLARYRDGRLEIVSLWEDDDGDAPIHSLFADSDNAVWATTARGLFRLKDGRVDLLDTRSGLPCHNVYAALYDQGGAFWLYARCGLLKVPAAEIEAWRERPEARVSAEVFDLLDGAFPSVGWVMSPPAGRSPDGRLWFSTGRIVQMIDPGRRVNRVPPPVHIEELVADRKRYEPRGGLSLPPLRGELEINFTALSLSVPRKVNFRYKLEGHDADWQESGTRRQVFYSGLAPGSYRFRVTACNSDGLWNDVGTSLDFHIAPTWYQTTSFRLLFLLTAAFAAWGLYRLRIRQVARTIGARFDERLGERTRLARELHDTFLQTVQGSKLVADDALDEPGDPARMRGALEKLSVWLGQATEEGRAALESMRTSGAQAGDLAEALRRAAETCRARGATEVTLNVIGESRDMHPLVRDEVYRIGYEAIRNACAHSGAGRLLVELSYAQDLTLRVTDDGAGIDPAVAQNGKPGHFGLQGMRERAARIGGRLTVAGSAAAGTEVTVVVPGGLLYRGAGSAPAGRLRRLLRR